ncbi:hypothetical protein ABG79_02130 [Caloramator mitchellensis]|uniref:Uncharacterized protein n=1 Tax=Caloramator mitchellensis TaxID=908809 RepID=A0A0R3JRJ0_CALMK|nr:hypothetical protein [Caloramator mitchellensis]KRQ86096.1 hypothetical protein ABG79_02130 [Caloramator mitchellensis]
MKKFLINIAFLALILIITFFGLGPVLFADGSKVERTLTFVFVLILYVLVISLYNKLLHYINR